MKAKKISAALLALTVLGATAHAVTEAGSGKSGPEWRWKASGGTGAGYVEGNVVRRSAEGHTAGIRRI